jgi:hypothetical protein
MKTTPGHVDLALFAALSQDIAAWDSGLQDPMQEYLSYMQRMVLTRGVSFIMIDMPQACKLVDHGLSSEYLDFATLPMTFGYRRERGRFFLGALFRQVWDHKGRLFEDVDPQLVYFLRQYLVLAKKVKRDCSDAATLVEVNNFLKDDNCLPVPSGTWYADELDVSSKLSLTDGYRDTRKSLFEEVFVPHSLLQTVQRVADLVVSRLPVLDRDMLRPKHGPGAVSDAKTGEDKYLFPFWPKKLDMVFHAELYRQSREDLHLEDPSIQSSPVEPPARLLAVPKTLAGPRLIASEPTAHQFIQQGLMRWLRDNLPSQLKLCIDFLDQEPSRAFCLRASATGMHASVDLKSASDRVSCWLVERIFRRSPSLLEALHASRTRIVVNGTGVGEDFHLLMRKFAPMGSAVTFPVQSIIYAICVMGTILYDRGMRVSSRNVTAVARELRVFGDDIIMPSMQTHLVASLFALLGLKVNMMKTHHAGFFRESCGMDAFKGIDITPIKVSSLSLLNTAEGLQSWIDTHNLFVSKGLTNLAKHCESVVPESIRKLIPRSPTPISSLYFLDPVLTAASKNRFNPELQRWETWALCVQVTPVRKKRDTNMSLLQYFLEAPSPDFMGLTPVWSEGYNVRNRSRLRKRWVSLR